jgi:hypothetical protein
MPNSVAAVLVAVAGGHRCSNPTRVLKCDGNKMLFFQNIRGRGTNKSSCCPYRELKKSPTFKKIDASRHRVGWHRRANVIYAKIERTRRACCRGRSGHEGLGRACIVPSDDLVGKKSCQNIIVTPCSHGSPKTNFPFSSRASARSLGA